MANRKPQDQKGIELRNAIRQAKASGDSGAFRQAQDAYATYRGRETGPQNQGQRMNLGNAKGVIRAQRKENQDTALQSNQMNNANVSGPGVNRTVTYDENGNPTVNVGMGEQEKGLYDRFMKMAGEDVDFSNLPAMPTDFSADRQRIEDQLYSREAERLNKQFGEQKADFDRQMSQRGIPIGSELYNKQLNNFEQQKQQAFSGARQNAIQTAGAEAQNLWSNTMGARQQGISEYDYKRNAPMNQFSGLMGLGAGLTNQFGGFQGSPVQNTDIGGIALGFEGLRRAGSGGTSQADWLARMQAQTQQQKDLMQFGQDLNNQNKPRQPGFGDYAGNLGGSFLGSLASGFGESFGSSWGNSLFGKDKKPDGSVG